MPAIAPLPADTERETEGDSSDASSTEADNDATQISIACRQYELFYELPLGSCTQLQVQRSSVGIQGWSEANLAQESGQPQDVMTDDDPSYQDEDDTINLGICHTQDPGLDLPCPSSTPALQDTWNNAFIHFTKRLSWKQCQRFLAGRT